MKPIFYKKSHINFRLIVVVILAISLFFFDRQYNIFNKAKNYFDTKLISFLFFVNNLREFFNNISIRLVNQKSLIFENRILKKEVLIMKANNLLFKNIKAENVELRKLLNSPITEEEYVTCVKVLAEIKNPYCNQIIIDQGLKNGVHNGQVVINDKGIVGQVIKVGRFNSRVLLICDMKHALPVQILPNNIRVIAYGVGCSYDLKIKIKFNDINNVHVGDIVVTSGIDSRFPEGYPVAIVSSIKKKKESYAIVYGKCNVDFQNLHYLLLLWSNSCPLSLKEVNKIANKRLIKNFH